MREQIAHLRPDAIRLRDEFELFSLETNADHPWASWQMSQITTTVNNNTQYSNLNWFLRDDTPMSKVMLSLLPTVVFTMIMLMMIFGGLDICVDASTIAPSPAGGFANTI